MTEWDAAGYDHVAALQRQVADACLATLTLHGDERVLDVGCGDGRVTAGIAARVPRGRVVGVDPSAHMIAWATTHAARPGLTFAVADARTLPFDAQFDLAVSFNALHWVPEQETALAAIRRALRPGGRAVLQQVCDGDRPALEDVIEATVAHPRWRGRFAGHVPPYRHVAPDAWRGLAQAAGFRVERLTVQDARWDFGTRDAFVAFARTTFVEWTDGLPEGDRDAFIVDVLDAYRAVLAAPADANAFRFLQQRAELTAA
jgi:ubiquinone/menaquinone biosynthesis C-methylase UbiE